MAADDSAERTHEPTPRRRQDARREGRILTSKDLSVFVATASGAAATLGLATVAPVGIDHFADALAGVSAARDTRDLSAALGQAAVAVLVPAAAIAVPVILAAILLQAATGGLSWVSGNMAFKPERINPLAGFGRMFSATALAELVKALAKVGLLGAATWWFLQAAFPTIAALHTQSPRDAGGMLYHLGTQLFAILLGVLCLIGAADLVWQMRVHNKSLRMTPDEVRREMREDNGSPELKGRQRQRQAEVSRRGARERAALDDVPRATSVITNPQHFAVALYYSPGETPTPLILARGTDAMARRIIERANRAGVPVLPVPLLARALYFSGDIGAAIDPRLYAAVAAILAHLWRLERGMRTNLPDVDLPPELRLDAHGRKLG